MTKFFGGGHDVPNQINAGLVWDGKPIDPGNVYRDLQDAYYVPFPTWWRRFVFRALSPRDIAVYLYVCTYMGPLQLSHPTIRTISDDLGTTNRHGVTASLQKLVDLGFLVRQQRTVSQDNLHPRYLYQRPSPEYTLVTLLQSGYINGYLQPTAKTKRRTQEQIPGRIDRRLGKIFEEPIREMIGAEPFAEYGATRGETSRREYLLEKLQTRLNEMRNIGSKDA